MVSVRGCTAIQASTKETAWDKWMFQWVSCVVNSLFTMWISLTHSSLTLILLPTQFCVLSSLHRLHSVLSHLVSHHLTMWLARLLASFLPTHCSVLDSNLCISLQQSLLQIKKVRMGLLRCVYMMLWVYVPFRRVCCVRTKLYLNASMMYLATSSPKL